MPLLTLTDAQLAYGAVPLLDRASFAMETNERIGLIGRNGTGKSSLLGVIAGTVALDGGELRHGAGLRIAAVVQEPVLLPASSIKASLLASAAVSQEHRLDEFLDRFRVNPAADPHTASGGERKRAALALAFALQPELLLLDEPTNHLDVDAILILENLMLKQAAGIVITHDRAFLDRIATRILELDRGYLKSYPGNYERFETLKAGELAAEALAQRKFDRFWAQEEIWIRKGIEARRTRNEGRVTRLEHLREERAARRARVGNIKLSVGSAQRSGKLVAELRGVSKSFLANQPVVKNLDLIVSRGDRIGLIGPNGAGKTTLIKLILGALEPDAGSVRLGTKLQPAYFDQMRAALDPEKTVAQTIAPGSDWVELANGRKHVMSYLGDFLFPPRRAQSPVRMLSGGERNRLLLARLFAQPANVLVLDEPTNDLDIESLELLEAALQDYAGTLLLVSHDRTFLDNIVTQTIAAEGGGVWKEYVGGYSDWLRQRPAIADFQDARIKTTFAREKTKAKLSYKETRELASLPKEIEALEAEQQALAAKLHTPEYFRQAAEVLRQDQRRSGEIESQLHEKLERWEKLEEKSALAD
ncbi:MAG: ATP-binding cassette domain-containing protein [Betaproteobacteria bacterium]|nr:ATP-binding cassette domain-containing protein [Betaproteobacteria bacterium]MSQ88362.1 ATP-binding cassette domain-containing protein [Betaproteobacteria bacterium]